MSRHSQRLHSPLDDAVELTPAQLKLRKHEAMLVANMLEHAQQAELLPLVGLSDLSTVCDCVVGGNCSLCRGGTYLGTEYQQMLSDDHRGATPHAGPPMCSHVCLCGATLRSAFELRLHVRGCEVGSNHDLPAEERPILAVAWVLYDIDAPSPYEAVVAAGQRRIPSRAAEHEQSTSAEQQAITIGLEDTCDRIPSDCVLLPSTDSQGMLRAFDATCCRHKSIRQEVKTPELGELRAARHVINALNARGVDVVTPVYEQAYHDRKKRGTTDGCTGVLARLNYACDLLAGAAARSGHECELSFYGAMQRQERAAHYWTRGGVPILGNPLSGIADAACHVRAHRALQAELARPENERSRATRLLRLAAAGVVDAEATAAAWHALPPALMEEAIRSMLGRMSATARELTANEGCDDSEAIKSIA